MKRLILTRRQDHETPFSTISAASHIEGVSQSLVDMLRPGFANCDLVSGSRRFEWSAELIFMATLASPSGVSDAPFAWRFPMTTTQQGSSSRTAGACHVQS